MPEDRAGTTTGWRGAPVSVRRVLDAVWSLAMGLGFIAQVAAVALGSARLAFPALTVAALFELLTSETEHPLRQRLRRIGLGLEIRNLVRGLLIVAAAIDVADRLALTAYAVSLLVLLLVARMSRWLNRKLTLEQPPLGELNLGAELELKSYLDVVRGRREYEHGLIGGVELLLALGLILDVEGTATPGALVIALATALLVGVAALLLMRFRRIRSAGLIERYVDGLREEIRAGGARVIVYFSGDEDATYQLSQWMPVFERLHRRPLLLLRERHHLERLPPTKLPVLYCRRHQDVEIALAADPRVVLYVGNAGRNMHFLRYGRPKHIFLNHGDSDKISSANPVVKVYDRLFVAGELAINRYRAAGIDLPDDRFRVVGRPQLDDVLDRGRRAGAGPPTVLYAPTWEGYYEAADYSSLERMGEALVDAILRDHPDVRIVFKPHPMSGHVRPAAAAARRRVATKVRAAGAPHIVATAHPGLDLLDWFDRSDVLLSDVSAVVTDWLHTDKPYLVTNPRGLEVEDFHQRFPSHRAAYLVGRDLDGLEVLAAALGDDPLASQRAEMKRRVLGEHPEGPLATFERELEEAIEWARRDAGRVVNTFSYD